MVVVSGHFNEPWRDDPHPGMEKIVTTGKIDSKRADSLGYQTWVEPGYYYNHGDTPRRTPGVGEGSSSYWDAIGARVMDRGQGELPGRAPEEPPRYAMGSAQDTAST